MIKINRWDFIALCEERTVSPGIVIEDHGDEIKFVIETTKRDYEKMKELLDESY